LVHTTTGCGEQGFPSAQPYLSHTPGANPFCCMFWCFLPMILFFCSLVWLGKDRFCCSLLYFDVSQISCAAYGRGGVVQDTDSC
ncbi:hypothetical protein BO78DRAFT_321595, partial [Aspergillus sclerotiicarbonarius CBS 121057]